MKFKLTSYFSPMGDQITAIDKLCRGLNDSEKYQMLLGVTGSGKTFTIANVVEKLDRPVLVLSHNKTLAAQLYGEFKQFFPKNSVNYFVSYYDYYQPEAFIASTNTYIEKDLQINQEIEKLRLSTTSALMSGRRDIIVVASVSCIYGMGNPEDFHNSIFRLTKGMIISRNKFLYGLTDIMYGRSGTSFSPGNFRVTGEVVDIFPPYLNHAYRITFLGNEVEEMFSIEPETGKVIEEFEQIAIFPANLFVTPKERFTEIIWDIQEELKIRLEVLYKENRTIEAKRLEDRVTYDLEMMRELGYCSGIENYSRFFDGRKTGIRPYCLMDYFPSDYFMVIDESHVTIPQLRAMYAGDRSRKLALVEHGFRLPAALDNRPLNFQEFEVLVPQTIYVSATPGDYELEQTAGVLIEQVIRPTGLLDLKIEIRSAKNQVDDLLSEIDKVVKNGHRVLVTTLTIRLSEELAKYLNNINIRARYIHSKIKTLERVDILRGLRLGEYDVLVGVNLLREGLDLPEVALVAILDADKEGFLRSERSLIQTIGRAARNSDGRVVMYADKITGSMQKTIDETNRRREIQMNYNQKHNITPTTIYKSEDKILQQTSIVDISRPIRKNYEINTQRTMSIAADPVLEYMSLDQVKKSILKVKKDMEGAVKKEDYLLAAQFRDEMFILEKVLESKK